MRRSTPIVVAVIFFVTHATNLQVPLYGTYADSVGLGSSLFTMGVAIAGTACYGFTYLGGMAEVVRLGGAQAARAVSGYFVCAYIGFGLPVILIGLFSDQFGIFKTLLGFGVLFSLANLGVGLYQNAETEKPLP